MDSFHVKNFPHLKFQSVEFIDLADAEAIIDGVTVPLHSHVLANNSKVFAQLFSSLAEDDTGNRGTPTSVTELLAGESLEGVLLLLLMFYHRETIKAVISGQTWGEHNKHAPEPVPQPEEQMLPALLQSAVRLADKLDCRYIIDELEKDTRFTYFDPLGWLVESRALKLHKVTAAALKDIAARLSTRRDGDNTEYPAGPISNSNTKWARRLGCCVTLLRDKRWLELDQITYALVMEARTLFDLRGHWIPGNTLMAFKDGALDNYAAPGDLITSELSPDTLDFNMMAMGGAGGVEQQLWDALPELQEEQAAEDFNGEWDDEEPEVIDD